MAPFAVAMYLLSVTASLVQIQHIKTKPLQMLVPKITVLNNPLNRTGELLVSKGCGLGYSIVTTYNGLTLSEFSSK